MDIASIASFLLPILLSMLSGEGENKEKFFPSSKKLPLYKTIDLWSCSKNMYGYGYRYPRAPRIAYYEDPEYRFKWVRAAIGNRAAAAKSPWIQFLRERGAFEEIGNYLRELADQYRDAHGGVRDTTKKGARQRIKKLQRAIAALEDQALLKDVAADLGDVYSADYVTDSINRLKKEIAALEATINWQLPAETTTTTETEEEEIPSQPSSKKVALKKKAKGSCLMSGLGYGYGYFY
jgi:hypothetical protein